MEDPDPKPMIIGTNNVFEVGCCILQSNFRYIIPGCLLVPRLLVEIVVIYISNIFIMYINYIFRARPSSPLTR